MQSSPQTSNKYQYLDNLMRKYADLRHPKAEEQFFSNAAFQSEIKFEPGERILYLDYQNLKFVLIKGLIPMIFSFVGYYLIYAFIFQAVEISEDLIFGILNSFLVISILIIVGFNLLKMYLQSKSYRYIITDRRIIVGYTFLQRWVRSVEYVNIVDIVVHQTFISRLFHTGNVMLITGSNEGAYVGGTGGAQATMMIRGFLNIKHPFRIKGLIKGLMRMYSEKHVEVPPLIIQPLLAPEIKFANEINLTPEEHIFKVYKRKRSSSLIKGLISWVVIPVYIFANLLDINITFNVQVLLWVGIIFVAGIVTIFIASKYHAQGFEFVITNQRIVMFKRFLSISIRDVIMGKITDISIYQMAVGRVADFGTVHIGTKGFERMIKFKDLYHIQGVPNVTMEKDDIRNIVLYFQRGTFYTPLMEMYDPEFLNI